MKQLFTCVHCGASLSEGAETCPVCGRSQRPSVPAPAGRRRLAMRLLAALSLLLIAAAVILRLVC